MTRIGKSGLPTANRVKELPYVQLLALLGESNLPPGGLASIRQLGQHTHLRPGLRVLHAGCNAGFLSRELARRTGCEVHGIDLAKDMVDAAISRALQEGLSGVVHHKQMDMRSMQFPDASFDVVLAGGSLAFVEGHAQAVNEWLRVVKPYGLVADVEFYYRVEPPAEVRRDVAQVIGVEVPLYDRYYWQRTFNRPQLHEYYRHYGSAGSRTDAEIKRYVDAMVDLRTRHWGAQAKLALHERLLYILSLFNENMRYMDYTLFVLRRVADVDEPLLFT
jgi:ubiquinone/menaquinone biosynthesis C-methylase UbiE